MLNHTLVLRTRNRYEMLGSTLELYRKFGYTGIIYIVDDSTDFERALSVSRKFNSVLRIQHEQGADYQAATRARRVAAATNIALKKIITEYYSITSDDDFHFPSFIESGIDFLGKNQDYAAVVGSELKVYFDESDEIIDVLPVRRKDISWDDPLDRLCETVNGSLAYYGVCRTKHLQILTVIESKTNRLAFTRDGALPDLYFWDEEIPWLGLVHASGKIKSLPHLLMDIRGIRPMEDRVEALVAQGSAGFSSPLAVFSRKGIDITLSRVIEDITEMVKGFGSQYSNDEINRYVTDYIWAEIAPFGARNIFNSNTSFAQVEKARLQNPIWFRALLKIKKIIFSKIHAKVLVRLLMSRPEYGLYINNSKSRK